MLLKRVMYVIEVYCQIPSLADQAKHLMPSAADQVKYSVPSAANEAKH